jgi:hypothetical protein
MGIMTWSVMLKIFSLKRREWETGKTALNTFDETVSLINKRQHMYLPVYLMGLNQPGNTAEFFGHEL